MTKATISQKVRAEKLARASEELFEIGALESGALNTSYVRRLNTSVARRRSDIEKNIP